MGLICGGIDMLLIKIKNNMGLTFVELMITVMLLSGAIAGTLLLLSTSMLSSQYAWDATVATSHAEHVFEEMQSRHTLAEIVHDDWSMWFDGQPLDFLPNEKISLLFVDENSDPLEIRLRIQWVRNQRDNNVELVTRMTK